MKKKVALSATAIAVLASAVPTHVAPVEAEEVRDPIYVSFDTGGTNDAGGGNGTIDSPYNQLREAIQKASNGDTIVIIGKATINDLNTGAAYIIDKQLTIKSNDPVPPVIDFRPGGLILGADVRFENVVLNLPNIGCNDIFANGHKLELHNVVTVGSAGKDINVYTGSLTSDSNATSKAGRLGHVVITTDGNFKAPKYGTKVTKLGAIYAGSSGGQSDIESLIEVNTPETDSTVSIGTIYGRGTGGQVNNADVNIKLNGLLFPTVDGYTGSSAKTNVEVTNQSASGRSFDCLNINKLTLTKGELLMRNAQLAHIPEVHLAQGTTLNLKNVAPEVTIDNYTGNGVVIIPKTGLLNLTNGVTNSNTLKLAVDFHFGGESDPATENHIYAITPKGSTIDFTPYKQQSAYELYPFDEGTELQWKFIQSVNKPQPEPEQPQPSPDEPEEEEEEVVISEFRVSDNKVDVPAYGAFQATYGFTVVGSKNETNIDLTKQPLEFYLDGSKAEFRPDTNDYYIENNLTTFKVNKVNGENTYQLVVTGFSNNLGSGTHTLTMGIKDTDVSTDLTLTVKKPTVDAVSFPNGSTKTVDAENATLGVEFPFNVVFDGKAEFTDLDYTVSLNEQVLKARYEYTLEGTGLRLALRHDYAGNAQAFLYKQDTDGNRLPLPVGTYNIKAVSETSQDFEFSIVVKDTTPTPPPTVEPDPEDKEEEPTTPSVTDVTFPNGNTKPVEVSKTSLGVEFPFHMTFNTEGNNLVEFKDLGYTLNLNGGILKFNQEKNGYFLDDPNLGLTFVSKGFGDFQALFVNLDSEGNRQPIPEGNYTIRAIGNSKDFEFNISVMPDTPTPPVDPDPEDKEEGNGGNTGGSTPQPPSTEEPTTPPSTGGGNTGGGSPSGGGTVTPPPSGGSGTTPPPPSTEEPTPTPTPVPPQEEVTNQVEGLEDLPKEIQQKVDSLMTDIIIQEKGVVLDLVGDDDDLSNVDTLEITKEGVFINVGEEKVKFETELDLTEVDWDNVRIIRVGGGPVPHKQNGEGLTITTSNFSNLLITSKEPEPFTDVNDDDWFKEYVEDAYNYGLVNGTTAETFDPNGAITRAQLAVILARAFELEPTSEDSTLSDIGDKWYASEVQALVDAGIIKGFSDGTFGGDKPVTRQQMALMLTRTVQSQGKDVTLPTKAELDKVKLGGLDKTSEEASDAIKYLALMEAVMSGPDIDFRPNSIATRAQATKVLVNTLPRTGLY